jgi:glycosyltransferase involved in cell wall biosynthesis
MHKVSIIIPYNKDRGYLQEAIDSVKAQTYKGEIELILSHSDKGVSHNLNEGIKKATGEFVKYLCDDDTLTPDSVERSVNAMKDNDFIHGCSFVFGEGRATEVFRPKVERPNLNRMILGNVIHGGTLMYRKDVFDRFGYFDESLWTGEEYDFNLMLLSKGAKIGYCKYILYNYRRHSEQKSLGRKADQRARANEIQKIRKRYV